MSFTDTLVTYGYGPIFTGIIDNQNKIRDLSSHVNDLNPSTLTLSNLTSWAKIDLEKLPEINNNLRIGSCINKPSNILCIGLNYSLHAKQTGSKLPKYPIVFYKCPDCLQGPYDPIKKRKTQEKLDLHSNKLTL